MHRAGGLASHLVIARETHRALVAWFLNGHPQGVREFEDVGRAIQFSERMQFQNWAVGWRLVADRDDAAPTPSDHPPESGRC
ncbi:MAG: hypothetical protein OEW19_00375 [Acidobacteriota bacterium]|nr:hypothetical protein [Acidobacteriota bacterium]